MTPETLREFAARERAFAAQVSQESMAVRSISLATIFEQAADLWSQVLRSVASPQEKEPSVEEVTTYTPMLWATLTEDQRYAEYVRVRKLAAVRADARSATHTGEALETAKRIYNYVLDEAHTDGPTIAEHRIAEMIEDRDQADLTALRSSRAALQQENTLLRTRLVGMQKYLEGTIE